MLRPGLVVAICFLCWRLAEEQSIASDKQRLYQVGTAKVDITPQDPILLSGYASRGSVEIDKVGQRLWARAIAIGSNADGPAILVSVDNCGVPLQIRQQVAAALRQEGIKAEQVTISSTHTHAGPMLTGVLENLVMKKIPPEQSEHIIRYTKSLTGQLIRAARQALKNRRPARLSFGIGRTRFAANRRTSRGPTDHDVPVLRAVDEQNRVHAIVVGYACHCTALTGVDYISGDWAGYSSEYLEEAYKSAVALTIIGCGADQNPAPRGTLVHTKQHGRSLAEEVKRIVGGKLQPLNQPVSCKYKEIRLNFARHPPRSEWEQRAKAAGITGHHARQILKKLDRGDKLPTALPYPIQTWTFGEELGMVFLADEVVVDYSLRLKRELDGKRLWVAGYCNDQRCYIPSERVLKEGGYEAGDAMVWYGWPGPFAAGLEDKIVAEVHRQLPAGFDSQAMGSPYFREAIAKIDTTRTGNSRPLPPQAAVAALQTHHNLRVELVAAEPLIIDPVAIDWAADGTLWVAEMHDYPMGLDGKYGAGGRVKLLRDTDKDGEYDQGTIFLDGLPFPTGVTSWGQGVLVCAAPDVIYAEDTDGDGVADVRKTLLTGFVTHNYQARVNSLSLGLDNWLYAATGIFGGIIKTSTGQTIDVSNRDFRFLPDNGTLEAVSGRTQQGRARDDFGNWFGCNNSNVLAHYPATERYFRRNPLVKPPPAEIGLGTGTLFPPKGLVTFELSGPPGRPTAACGLGIYRDSLLGQEYAGNTFTCEPVNQLVHRRVLKPAGVTFTAKRAPTETDREFLASSDNWFRPVQVRTGPDGALYVVDMCRYVIEHPRWIPPATRNALDLRAGDTLGRIYRVLPQQASRRTVPNLADLDLPELVAALDSPNGTTRDLVQHTLMKRGSPAAVEPLEQLFRSSKQAATRVQALYVLDGLQRLSDELVLSALADAHVEVRRHAIRLAESRLADSTALQHAVLARLDDKKAEVQLQLAYSLGEWHATQAAIALADLAVAHQSDTYIRAAILSSATAEHLPVMLARVLGARRPEDGKNRLADELLQLALRQGAKASFDRLVLQVAGSTHDNWNQWQFQALAGIVQASHSTKKTLQPATRQMIDRAAAAAAKVVVDDDTPLDRRIAAAQLSAAIAQPADLDRMTSLLTPQQPPALQIAVISALSKSRQSNVQRNLLSNWASLGPASRKAVLDAVSSNDAGTDELLAALERGVVKPGEIDAVRRQQLLEHRILARRERAAKVLKGVINTDRNKVIQKYRESVVDGDEESGKLAFAKHCSACHRLDGVGHVVGPDLAALTNRSRDALLVAILDPSRDVDQRFAGYTAITTDGRTFSGILTAESSNAVTLKAQENKIKTILRADLELMRGTGKSMMPEGIERDVTPAVLADILAYLGAGSGLPYRYAGTQQADVLYPDRPSKGRLTDGVVGSSRFNDGKWVGVRAGGVVGSPSLIFDFGLPTKVRTVKIDYGVNHTPGGIHAPDRVTVSYSDNGIEFDTDKAFSPFDDSADGRGAYQIARRTAQLKVAGRKSRFVRLDFQNDGEWTFLTEIAFNTPLGEQAAAEDSEPQKPPANAAAKKIAALVAEVKVGTMDEYRKIPDIWRVAIAAGKRNNESELLAILDQSLPQPQEQLYDWQAVVIGGGLINGLTQAGVWPRSRIDQLINRNKSLRPRWENSLSAAVKMADNKQIKNGTRYDALRMVAMLSWKECGDQLKRYCSKEANGELQQGAVSGLGDVSDSAATKVLIKALPQLTPRNQKFAAESLLRSPERIAALLTAVANGDVKPSAIPTDVKKKLHNNPDEDVQATSRRLLP